MSEIINLRQARKGKQREKAEQQAAENRVRHGRDKAAKQRDAFEKQGADRAHDGRKLNEEPTE